MIRKSVTGYIALIIGVSSLFHEAYAIDAGVGISTVVGNSDVTTPYLLSVFDSIDRNQYISWTTMSLPNTASFYIEQSKGSDFSEISNTSGWISSSVSEYAFRGLMDGSYCYRVKSKGYVNDESSWSNVQCATVSQAPLAQGGGGGGYFTYSARTTNNPVIKSDITESSDNNSLATGGLEDIYNESTKTSSSTTNSSSPSVIKTSENSTETAGGDTQIVSTNSDLIKGTGSETESGLKSSHDSITNQATKNLSISHPIATTLNQILSQNSEESSGTTINTETPGSYLSGGKAAYFDKNAQPDNISESGLISSTGSEKPFGLMNSGFPEKAQSVVQKFVSILTSAIRSTANAISETANVISLEIATKSLQVSGTISDTLVRMISSAIDTIRLFMEKVVL